MSETITLELQQYFIVGLEKRIIYQLAKEKRKHFQDSQFSTILIYDCGQNSESFFG